MSNVVSIQGYELHVHDGEPMVKDLDLAIRLGYKEPRTIRRLIKRMLDNGLLSEGLVRVTVTRSKNKQQVTEFLLREKAVLKVITKSETEKADQITDEMIDVFINYRSGNLAAPITQIDFSNEQQVAGILAQSIKKVKEQGEKIKEDAPKVEFYDQFVNKDGLYGLQNAGRALNQKPNKFVQWLKQEYLFYQGGNLVAKARYIQQGVFEVKTSTVDDKVRPQTYVTPKGLQYLANKLKELAA